MAVFAHSDLKRWRESLNITAADLAERISCDTGTLYRYESGKLKPNPDVMYQICLELGNVNRWCDWMRTEFPTSYARVHPDYQESNLQGALMLLYAELADVSQMEQDVLRDGADGHIDDPNLKEKLCLKLTNLLGRVQLTLNIMSSARG